MTISKRGLLFCLAALFAASGVVAADVLDNSGKDVSGKNYADQVLDKSNFSDAICVETRFERASLKKVNFKGANLNNAGWARANCTEADFTGCTGNIYFQYSNMTQANLEGVKFSVGYQVNFKNANLKKAKFDGHDSACIFAGADLRGANLRGFHITPGGKLLKGAFYNDDTAFPDNFDPKEAGMIFKEDDKKSDKDGGKKDPR